MNRSELMNVTLALAVALTEKAGNQIMEQRIPELVLSAKKIIEAVDKEFVREVTVSKQILMESEPKVIQKLKWTKEKQALMDQALNASLANKDMV